MFCWSTLITSADSIDSLNSLVLQVEHVQRLWGGAPRFFITDQRRVESTTDCLAEAPTAHAEGIRPHKS